MATFRFGRIALLTLFFFAGCKSDSLVNDVIDDLDASSNTALANDITRLINQARAQSRTCGNERFSQAPAVAWSDLLAEAASAHSRDMAANDLFSHTGSDGSNAGARIGKTGYAARTWGENIAAGYPSAGSVIEGWLDSPGHCANIMNPAFEEIGAASAERAGTAYGTYWTLVLGAAR